MPKPLTPWGNQQEIKRKWKLQVRIAIIAPTGNITDVHHSVVATFDSHLDANVAINEWVKIVNDEVTNKEF